jgi:hypothetical protein
MHYNSHVSMATTPAPNAPPGVGVSEIRPSRIESGIQKMERTQQREKCCAGRVRVRGTERLGWQLGKRSKLSEELQ